MLSFVDTNIWVYRLMSVDPADPEAVRKQSVATELLASLAAEKQIVVSAQVLSEFFTTTIRKGTVPLSLHDAFIETNFIASFPVISISASLVQAGIARMQKNQLSYWDALIVESALRAGASILYSEDLQHGMRFDSLEVRNPFLAGAGYASSKTILKSPGI